MDSMKTWRDMYLRTQTSRCSDVHVRDSASAHNKCALLLMGEDALPATNQKNSSRLEPKLRNANIRNDLGALHDSSTEEFGERLKFRRHPKVQGKEEAHEDGQFQTGIS